MIDRPQAQYILLLNLQSQLNIEKQKMYAYKSLSYKNSDSYNRDVSICNTIIMELERQIKELVLSMT